jgi:hypothetical protein
MFKVGTVAGLTSAQGLVQDTQKDVNKEGTTDHKERNNIARSARKLNGYCTFCSFFIFFLILYDLNRKHTNFKINWTEGVAYRNSTIFSTKVKA